MKLAGMPRFTRGRLIALSLLVAVVILVAPSAAWAGVPLGPTTYHVNAGAPGGNGSTWAGAFNNLDLALELAVPGDEIWVAAGTYKPTLPQFSNDPRSVSFRIRDGVAIYGGFPSTGDPVMTDRNWSANPTILSGEIGDETTTTDNAYRILEYSGDYYNGVPPSFVLDGFTICGAYGDSNLTSAGQGGGGMLCAGGAPLLENLRFENNEVFGTLYNYDGGFEYGGGGGLSLVGSDATLEHVTFANNVAHALPDSPSAGGGLISYGGRLRLQDVLFDGNFVDGGMGGGWMAFAQPMYDVSPSVSMDRVRFIGNGTSARDFGYQSGIGGGMVLFGQDDIAQITNSEFRGNKATWGGGLVAAAEGETAGQLNMANVLVASNVATATDGTHDQVKTGMAGGMLLINADGHLTNVTVANNYADLCGGVACENAEEAIKTSFENCVIAGNGSSDDDTSFGVNAASMRQMLSEETTVSLYASDVYPSAEATTVVYLPGLVAGALVFDAECIDSDPQFVSDTDFHLTGTSPAINAGDNTYVPSSVTKDLDGSDRFVGGRVDMGAYELQDLDPPIVCPPADMTVEATGPSGAVVTYTATANDPQEGLVPVWLEPPSGWTFPLGTTEVTAYAQDSHYNVGSAKFKVTVRDTTPPDITVPADQEWDAADASGGTVYFFSEDVYATDLVDGPVEPEITPPSGSHFPMGTTMVSVTATDQAGNAATKTFKVTVSDKAPPKITAPPSRIVQATEPSGAIVNFASEVVVTDNVDSYVPWHAAPPSGSIFPLGNNIVWIYATDSAGNAAARQQFKITVVDTMPPALSNGKATPSPAIEGQSVDVTVTATDIAKNIGSIEYCLDNTCIWLPMDPCDGTYDWLHEDGHITLAGLSVGSHTVWVRATDSAAAPNTSDGTFAIPITVNAVPQWLNADKQAVLTELRGLLPSLNAADKPKMQDAINHLGKSLSADRWIDGSHPKPGAKGGSVFNDEKAAVVDLKSLGAKNKSHLTAGQMKGHTDRLMAVDRAIASLAITEAQARHGKAAKIKAAQNAVAAGDKVAGTSPDKAIDQYKAAWTAAIGA